MSTSYEHILIAIHGIGAQARNATVRSVATRLAHSAALYWKPEIPPLAPQPLGWFHTDVRDVVKVAPLDDFDTQRTDALARTGFTEVFWADIPQEVVTEGRTMDETKAWAQTIVARARSVFKKRFPNGIPDAEKLLVSEPDFALAGEVLEDVIETVHVLENLTFLAEKAGVMKFDLDEVLREYLGDVQIVTEFSTFRTDIVGRFHAAMEQIHREHPQAKLHIVAHSEGTVVSLLGLLHALSGTRVLPACGDGDAVLNKLGRVPSWLQSVHGFMTLGSPIDKHLLLWPALFKGFDFTPAKALYLNTGHQIHWRNYFDYGDPVGFRLETVRKWLGEHEKTDKFAPFEFTDKHDHGFARYLLPGKAHNDYWDDGDVFEHFIVDVVQGNPKQAQKPLSRPRVGFISTAIPYVISFAILLTGTFVLLRAALNFLNPDLDPLQRYIRYTVLGLAEQRGGGVLAMGLLTLRTAVLVAGATALARVPRLAAGARWFWIGLGLYVASAVFYLAGFVGESLLTYALEHAWRDLHMPPWSDLEWFSPILTVALAGGAGVLSYLLIGKSDSDAIPGQASPRQQRFFQKGMRPLIFCGGLAVLLLVGLEMRPHSDLTDDERRMLSAPGVQELAGREAIHQIDRAHLTRPDLNLLLYPKGTSKGPQDLAKTAELLTPHPAVWPLLLGGAAFLYLWWLAALIFDLAFIWHRYIRNSIVNLRLMQWKYIAPLAPTAPTAQATAPTTKEASSHDKPSSGATAAA